MKICKQCNRELSDDQFRPIASRGTGKRKRACGTRSICRQCETYNVKAYNLVAKLTSGEDVNNAKLKDVLAFYESLVAAGYTVHTNAARQLMDLCGRDAGAKCNREEASTRNNDADLYEHIAKLRTKSYDSVDAADSTHRKLETRLRLVGLYEEATNLLDDWWLE